MTLRFALCALLLLVLPASGDALAEGKKYGKKLVAEYRLPASTLVKMEEFKPSPPAKGESVAMNALLADTETWRGPEIELSNTANPYNIVVTVAGTAIADGDAVSLWQAGWQLEDGARLNVLPGLTKSDVKAGQRLTLTAVATPTTFKQSRTSAVVLGLVKVNNMRLDSIDVAVWSGIPGTSFLEGFRAFYIALVGLVMFGLWWFWFRR
jgi:hypothetical protein